MTTPETTEPVEGGGGEGGGIEEECGGGGGGRRMEPLVGDEGFACM